MSERDRIDLDHLAGHAARPDPQVSEHATWRLAKDPNFLRPMDMFIAENPFISERSRFCGMDWTLDDRPPGKETSGPSFREIDLDLANELKVAILVGLAHPGSRWKTAGSIRPVARGLTILGGWMTHAGLGSISQLGAGCGELLMEALFEFLDLRRRGVHDTEAGDWDPRRQLSIRNLSLGSRGPTAGMVETAAMGLVHLWDMREEIHALTGAALRGKPFAEDTAIAVAQSWGEAGERTTLRLADPVVELLERSAHRLMGTPARDVARMVGEFVRRYGETGDRCAAADAVLENFAYSTVDGEDHPWWSVERHALRQDGFARLARLVHLIRDAGAVLILLATGQRPQEFLGLMGGHKERSLLKADHDAASFSRRDTIPRSVTETLSKSGFTVLLLLNGHVFKRSAKPRPVSWLLGGRQDGGADPRALDAMCVLEDIHAPLRAFAVDGAKGMLIVDFVSLPNNAVLATAHCDTGRLGDSVKRSIPLMADLSSLPDGNRIEISTFPREGHAQIALYQFRKTYAQTRYKLDEGLLAAIAHQLQHLNPRDTKISYITGDPEFQRELAGPRSALSSMAVRQEFGDRIDPSETMAPQIDAVLALRGLRCVRYDAAAWSARLAAAEAMGDRLRPLAGMEALSAQEAGGLPAAPLSVARTANGHRDGAATLRAFAANRRRWLSDVEKGEADAGRPARDRMLSAARSLNEWGFPVDARVSDRPNGDDGGMEDQDEL